MPDSYLTTGQSHGKPQVKVVRAVPLAERLLQDRTDSKATDPAHGNRNTGAGSVAEQ